MGTRISASARRKIEAAVDKINGPADRVGPKNRRLTVTGETCWAELTSFDDTTGTYAWQEVRPEEQADPPDSWEHPTGDLWRSGNPADGTGAIDPNQDDELTALVSVNQVVLLRRTSRLLIVGVGDPPEYETRWAIVAPGGSDSSSGAWFVLTGVAAVGKYYAKPIIPLGTPIDPATDLTYGDDVGTNPTDAVLLINVAELANDTGTPWLSQLNAGNVFFATHWGETNEDPPKGVFIMHGVHNAPCEEP